MHEAVFVEAVVDFAALRAVPFIFQYIASKNKAISLVFRVYTEVSALDVYRTYHNISENFT